MLPLFHTHTNYTTNPHLHTFVRSANQHAAGLPPFARIPCFDIARVQLALLRLATVFVRLARCPHIAAPLAALATRRWPHLVELGGRDGAALEGARASVVKVAS